MNAHSFERTAGALALFGAALWAVTWVGPTVVFHNPGSHAASLSATQIAASLAFLLPLVAVPALGGLWLLRRRHRRVNAGAGLVAATGLVVTATIPALLALVFAFPAAWQLLGFASVLVVALAGGFAAAALMRNPTVQWSPRLSRHSMPVARVALLGSTLVVAATMQPPLREVLAVALRRGLEVGVTEFSGLPSSMQALALVGFAAMAITGVGAATVRPPAIAAAAGTAVAAYAIVGVVHATTAGHVGAGFWLHTAAVAVLAVSIAAVADTRLQRVRVPEAANAVGMHYASVASPQTDPIV